MKKREISGLSRLELELACNSLKRLKETIAVTEEDNEVQEDAAERSEDFLQQLEDMIASMESRQEGPRVWELPFLNSSACTRSYSSQSLSFSSANEETLSRFNINFRCGLKLKPGIEALVEKSKLVGKDELWSSSNFHRHLAKLEKLVTKTNETSARVWIDAFFFRASEMVPQGSHMVLNIEHAIPITTINPTKMLATISGIADYTAVVAKDHDADTYHDDPRIATARSLRVGFFVTEVRLPRSQERILTQAYPPSIM